MADNIRTTCECQLVLCFTLGNDHGSYSLRYREYRDGSSASLQILTVLDGDHDGIQLGWLEHNSIVLDLYGKEESRRRRSG